MIERLFIDKRSDGGYDVVCNDLFTAVEGYSTVGIAELVGEAFEVLTDLYRDECNADDITGPRIGYKPVGMLAVAYGGDVRVVPEFQLTRAIARLMETVE